MKSPTTVPPKPDLRERAARGLEACCAGRRSAREFISRVRARSSSHLVRRADAQHSQTVPYRLPGGARESEPGTLGRGIVDEETLGIIVTVEFRGQFPQIGRHEMRCEFARSRRKFL